MDIIHDKDKSVLIESKARASGKEKGSSGTLPKVLDAHKANKEAIITISGS